MKKVVVNPQLTLQDEVVIGDKTIGRDEPVEISEEDFKVLGEMTGTTGAGDTVPLVVESTQVKKIEEQMARPQGDNPGGATTQVATASGQPAPEVKQ